MWILLFLIAAVIALLYLWIQRRYTFWQRKGIPQFPPTFPFGNFAKSYSGNKKQPVEERLLELYGELKKQGAKHGGIYLLLTPVWLPVDLNLIKNIFQKDFAHFTDHARNYHHEKEPLTENIFSLKGAKWKWTRAKVSPAFTSGKIKSMFELMIQLGEVLEKKLSILDGQTIDMVDQLACFYNDCIASCVFGFESKCMENPDADFRKYGKRAFMSNSLRQFLEQFFPWGMLANLGYKQMDRDLSHFFTDIASNAIESREKNNIYRKDLVHLFLQLKNKGKISDDGDFTVNGEGSITKEEIINHMFILYVAGFESTSRNVAFLMYELALHQECQNRLREEIWKVLEKYDGKLCYEALHEMTYAQQCIEETLRLYPAAPMIFRTCTKDYKIPDTDITIAKGTQVFISMLGIHRDPEYYDKPDVFDPERFTEENKAKRDPYSWFAFGEGPRQCLGLRFAIMMVKVGLVYLLKNHKFTLNEKTPRKLTIKPGQLLLRADEDIFLDVEKLL